MNNWWLAVLEHFGVLTNTEAEHLAEKIANSVGSEKYSTCYEIVGDIIKRGNFDERIMLRDLENMVNANDAKIRTLEAAIKEDKLSPLAIKLKDIKAQLDGIELLVKQKSKESIAKPQKAM